jgi:hypothetical protein
MVLPESSTFCKDEYAMKQDNVIGLKSPGVPSAVSDALTDLLRDGARQMLATAVEAEVEEFLARHQALRDDILGNASLALLRDSSDSIPIATAIAPVQSNKLFCLPVAVQSPSRRLAFARRDHQAKNSLHYAKLCITTQTGSSQIWKADGQERLN